MCPTFTVNNKDEAFFQRNNLPPFIPMRGISAVGDAGQKAVVERFMPPRQCPGPAPIPAILLSGRYPVWMWRHLLIFINAISYPYAMEEGMV
jgi:hypothetical protein